MCRGDAEIRRVFGGKMTLFILANAAVSHNTVGNKMTNKHDISKKNICVIWKIKSNCIQSTGFSTGQHPSHTLNILSFIPFEYPTFISFILCIFATFKATFERKVMIIARCAQTRRHRLFHLRKRRRKSNVQYHIIQRQRNVTECIIQCL